MGNTHSNLTGDLRRIHATFPVAEAAEGLSLSLSSQEGNLAQVGLQGIAVRRRFGRKVLSIDIVDRSGFAELRGEAAATSRLAIPLGHTAVIGRNLLDLPLLESETVSEEHITLTYIRTKDGDSLSIHDNASINGSHIIGSKEQTWQERLDEISNNDPGIEHHDPDINPADYDWLYGSTNDRYPALEADKKAS